MAYYLNIDKLLPIFNTLVKCVNQYPIFFSGAAECTALRKKSAKKVQKKARNRELLRAL